jgi:hypothetical protein
VKIANVWIFIGVVVLALISGRAPLHAQSPSEPLVTGGDDKPWNQGVPVETREAARQMLLEGNRLFNIPLFARAAEQYAAALGKWKHPAFYFNLALAQLNLGQEVEAHENLEKAIRYGEEPLGAEQFKEAQEQLQAVERQLGRIRVTCQTPGAEVTLDGVTLFTGPGSRQEWVKAKDHEITAKKRNYLSEAKRVAASPGQIQAVELTLITLSEATEAGRRWAMWKPWLVVAAGGAVAATGGVLHALSSRNFSNYDQQFLRLPCATMMDSRPIGCPKADIPSDLSAQLNRATREQQIAVGAYIVGGSVIAAGIVLVYMNRPRLVEQGTANSPGRSVAIEPTVSADMLGIQVRVSH